MLIYIAHEYGGDLNNVEKAKRITHDLQVADTENTYLCPLLALSHLKYKELSYEDEMAICLDMLSRCDGMFVASKISEGVRREIDFAKSHGIEVAYVEN